MIKFVKVAILILFTFFMTLTSWALQSTLSDKVVIVGTKEAPPFSMKNKNGTWRGVSIDLWKEIALQNKINYEFKEYNLNDLLEAVKNSKVDVAVAALTITAEREKYMDFSHPFYTKGLGIAVSKSNSSDWFVVLKGFISWKFLSVISVLVFVLALFGSLVWFFESRSNAHDFSTDPIKGLLDGFWWSAVTMTTVGYGDKSPKTFGGRFVALIWMFTSVIIISSFTAAITSAVTVNQLEGSINGPGDLVKVKVGVVSNTASAKIISDQDVLCNYYETLKDALDQLKIGQLNAVVYDVPLLQYLVNKDFKDDLMVLPNTFIDQPYGFAFPQNYSNREQINQTLLEIINSPKWENIVNSYLGPK